MGASPVLNPNRRVRCPSCGTERLQLRSEPDRIDRVTQTPSDRVRRLFIANMQLYHCRVCRLQFYDIGQPAGPAAQQTAEAAVEKVALTEPAPGDHTVIGNTVTIQGRVSSGENVLLNGQIEGDVEMPGQRLTIGTAALICGDIRAAEAVALGTVQGNVDARERLTLRSGAIIVGNVRTPSLRVEEGAFIRGQVETA